MAGADRYYLKTGAPSILAVSSWGWCKLFLNKKLKFLIFNGGSTIKNNFH
jgi:hypothetical protein